MLYYKKTTIILGATDQLGIFSNINGQASTAFRNIFWILC